MQKLLRIVICTILLCLVNIPYLYSNSEHLIAEITEKNNSDIAEGQHLHNIEYIYVNQKELKVVWKYNEWAWLGTTFGLNGINNLPDFGQWFFFYNNQYDFGGTNPVKTYFTDYFSPYVVTAEGNIDGDNPSSMHFTGGNHGYNNTGENTKATARNTVYKVFVDGKETNDFEGRADNLEIRIVNLIQATNTKKADGTGREVLEEKITLKFDGCKWNYEICVRALEKVKIFRYYGAQCDMTIFADQVVYISGNNAYQIEKTRSDSESFDKNCRKIQINGDIDTEIEISSSSVSPEYNSTEYGAFYKSYGKTYFNIINSSDNPLNLKVGEGFEVQGHYKFKEVK